jgi:hypothetical protein
MAFEAWQSLSNRSSYQAYVLLSVIAVVAAVSVSLVSDDSPFDRFLAGLPAPLVIAASAGVGALSLRLLSDREWSIGSDARWTPVIVAFAFGAVAVTVDTMVPFPEDTNVEWPASALYYPAVAFLAEIVFHVVPIAAIVLVSGWRFGSNVNDWRVWLIIGAVAAGEAGFQVAGSLTDGSDSRLVGFVAVHLFAIGVAELTMFRQFGFSALVTFRMVYYLLWHVAWGHLRLSILF